MKIIFLVLASTITIAGVLPYLRDILRGTTKPNIVSWITWTLLTGIATAAEIAAHEYVTAIFTGAAVVETCSVVALGLKHGYVKYRLFDTACQIAAIVGIILWQVFNSPAIGVIGAVLIDFVGALPTLRHSWIKPSEETWQTYALSAIGGGFAIFALTDYNWVSLPYAVYIVIINIGIAGVLITRRRAIVHG